MNFSFPVLTCTLKWNTPEYKCTLSTPGDCRSPSLVHTMKSIYLTHNVLTMNGQFLLKATIGLQATVFYIVILFTVLQDCDTQCSVYEWSISFQGHNWSTGNSSPISAGCSFVLRNDSEESKPANVYIKILYHCLIKL